MEAKVQLINNNYGNAKAITPNSIAIVFKLPADSKIKLGDILDIDLLIIDEEQIVQNMTIRTNFKATIESQNVHDLMLPASHGSTRFPSLDRRKGA